MTMHNHGVTFVTLKQKIHLSCQDPAIIEDLNQIQNRLSNCHSEIVALDTALTTLLKLFGSAHTDNICFGDLELLIQPHIEHLTKASQNLDDALR